MAKPVVNMEPIIVLIQEIITDGAKEVDPGYKPRRAYDKGILENKGIFMNDIHPFL